MLHYFEVDAILATLGEFQLSSTLPRIAKRHRRRSVAYRRVVDRLFALWPRRAKVPPAASGAVGFTANGGMSSAGRFLPNWPGHTAPAFFGRPGRRALLALAVVAATFGGARAYAEKTHCASASCLATPKS
ncbi:MAG: hypothetical protein WDN49_05150 [Acetobacteraceae bacterium]